MALLRVLSLLPLVAAYCPAGNTVIGDSNLGAVSLIGQGGTRIDDNSNCPGETGIRDRTYLNVSLAPGRTYTLNFDATTCDSGWQRIVYAFIDFNQNDVYDPEELLGQQQVDNRVEPVPVSFQFTVPTAARVGSTRMRVFVVESGWTANPCLIFSYGGVKEFTILVSTVAPPTPGLYCDAGNTVAEGSNLGFVQLAGLLRTDINDQTNCPGGVGVRDFTKLAASVMPGGTFNLDLDVTTCNGRGFPRLAYAYVDWNQNLVYDTDELVGVFNADSTPTPIDVRLTASVPCSALPGITRMRVMVAEGAHEPNPCLMYAYGGAKEYSVNVLTQLDKPCLPPASYCKTGNSMLGDSNLGQVNLVGVQGTAIHDASNCPSQTGLRNLTNLSVWAQPGGTYTLTFQATTCGLGWARLAYAYIDFNGDSIFEPSELLGTQIVDNRVTPVEVSFTFDVPCVGNGALVGVTRMRVFVVEGGISADACAIFNYGAAKEFSFEILNKPTTFCSVRPPGKDQMQTF